MDFNELPQGGDTVPAPQEGGVISNYFRNFVVAIMNGRSVRQIDTQEAWSEFVRRIDALSRAMQEELPDKP